MSADIKCIRRRRSPRPCHFCATDAATLYVLREGSTTLCAVCSDCIKQMVERGEIISRPKGRCPLCLRPEPTAVLVENPLHPYWVGGCCGSILTDRWRDYHGK